MAYFGMLKFVTIIFFILKGGGGMAPDPSSKSREPGTACIMVTIE